MLEEKMNEKGYLDGSTMATSFNMLRANDLIWSFVVNNYNGSASSLVKKMYVVLDELK